MDVSGLDGFLCAVLRMSSCRRSGCIDAGARLAVGAAPPARLAQEVAHVGWRQFGDVADLVVVIHYKYHRHFSRNLFPPAIPSVLRLGEAAAVALAVVLNLVAAGCVWKGLVEGLVEVLLGGRPWRGGRR